MTTTQDQALEGLGNYKFGWADSDAAGAAAHPDAGHGVLALAGRVRAALRVEFLDVDRTGGLGGCGRSEILKGRKVGHC